MENVHALFVEGPMDFGDEPSPPSKEEIDFDTDIEILCGFLDRAREDAVADQMTIAFNMLRKLVLKQKAPRPSTRQRDEILAAITNARGHVKCCLRDNSRDERAGDWGMDALMGLTYYWAETDKERAARHPDTLYDLLDHSGMGRNELRSAQMFQSLQERASRRQADMVEHYRPMFLEHEAG